MDSILKKGVLLVSLTGIMTAFPMAVHAADIDDQEKTISGTGCEAEPGCERFLSVHDR